jgi:hypothetical protein
LLLAVAVQVIIVAVKLVVLVDQVLVEKEQDHRTVMRQALTLKLAQVQAVVAHVVMVEHQEVVKVVQVLLSLNGHN